MQKIAQRSNNLFCLLLLLVWTGVTGFSGFLFPPQKSASICVICGKTPPAPNLWKQTNASGTTRYLTGGSIDQWLARSTASGVNWYLTDRLGSVTGITNSAGSLINSTTYDSFGHILSQSNASVADALAFTGREFDAESGLYYFRARYYNPDLGRFLSEDPVGFQGFDVNVQRYAFNSPLNGRDNYGLSTVSEYGSSVEEFSQEAVSAEKFITTFYTGSERAREAARALAAANKYRAIFLPDSFISDVEIVLDLATRQQAVDYLSAGVAEQTSEAYVVYDASIGIRATSVFARIERPILEALKIKIIYIPI